MAADMTLHFDGSVFSKRCRDGELDSAPNKQRKHGGFDYDSVSAHPWTYDVFLSFRGKDTRQNFTGHLCQRLKDSGVNVFMDDSLQRGEDISSQLIETIRSSRISVVIFSRNYAQSRWCLQELCEIMECRNKSPGQLALPVFYDVDPSDVRKQTGYFGEVFAKHDQDKGKEAVARWRDALAEAGSLSGWDVTNSANGPEQKIVRSIARKICGELNNTYLDVVEHPIGLEYRRKRVNKYLNDGSDDVQFIVITGIGGIGKTTLAKAVYNQFFHTFEAKCFLANVGENSKQPDGLVRLQEQLLHDTLKCRKMHVENIHRGSSVIRKRLRNRRVLVILDDVSHRDQLKALARKREWFGCGSRIIITTRDLDSVKEVVPYSLYQIEFLDDKESLKLFWWHAFRHCDPGEEFIELSQAVVRYCEGLPLALVVLGSFLLDRSMEEWKSALKQLRRIPHGDIQKVIEISYHVLESDNDKKLFLDIACFFVGSYKDDVVKILEACDMSVEVGLSVLSRRSLIKITDRNKLEMHDVIRDMGREIVRKESPHNLGERSRLFSDTDVLAVLQNHLGTVNVEGLVRYSSESAHKKITEKVEAKAFEEMRRLRLLKLDNINVDGDYGLISKDLRWLCWHGFSLDLFPDEFCMKNLVVIDIQYSNLRTTRKTTKFLGNLKVLNLSHSHFLAETPDFSKLPNLEELIMEDCRGLKEVDGSIGHLERLVSVNLRNCGRLKSIPDSICRVKSLQILDISGCSMINHLPNDFGELESLTEFLADGAPITNLPLSFAKLKNLSRLFLYGYKGSNPSSVPALVWSWVSKIAAPKENNQLISPLSGFRSLTDLSLVQCNLSKDGILEGIGTVRSLTNLYIKKSDFCHLPTAISSLSKLHWVTVEDCPKVELIPEVPPSVVYLSCKNCPRLADISYPRGSLIYGLDLGGCKNLSDKCIESLVKSQELARPWEFPFDHATAYLSLPLSNIPKWFEKQSAGASLSFQFPPCHACELTIAISYVMSASRENVTVSASKKSYSLYLINETMQLFTVLNHFQFDYSNEDEVFVFSIEPSSIMKDVQDEGIKVALDVETVSSFAEMGVEVIVKGVGVHLRGNKCPSCRLIHVDDAEAGPSYGGSSGEHLPVVEPTRDLTVDQQWILRFEIDKTSFIDNTGG